MRQKKSNIIYYVIAAILLLNVGLVIFTEVPIKIEHVEEVIK